jgi:hypothetical protein
MDFAVCAGPASVYRFFSLQGGIPLQAILSRFDT